jgi:hypothetical protein
MPIRVVRGVFAAALLSTVLSAIPASASTRVYVRVGPPAPIVEVRPVAPGPRYVWVDGYHRWNGRALRGCQGGGSCRRVHAPYGFLDGGYMRNAAIIGSTGTGVGSSFTA